MKTSKFRRWLVHKLGGIMPSDVVTYEVKTQNIKLVPVYARYEISNMACFSEAFEDALKRELKIRMLDYIQPVYTVEKDEARLTYIYKAKIELPEEYIKHNEEEI